MEGSLDIKSLPLGFRFHPTNVELIMFNLKKKVQGKSLGPQVMSELDVNKFAPWDLPAMAYLKSKDRNWYFFCPRSKKYPNGGRVNRSSKWGYWKSTGEDKDIEYNSRVVGKIKHLVFHRGKAPNGERTNWVMHEYRLEDKLLAGKGVSQGSYVICKLFEKSGTGPKNGEDYGAHFVEEEWDSDGDDTAQEGKAPTPTSLAAAATMTYSSTGPSKVTPVPTAPPYFAAPTGPYFAAPTTAPTHTPYFTAPAATINSPNSDVSMGTPCISVTYADVPKAPAASVGSVIDLPTTEDEVDWLLKNFTEDAGDVSNIYIGLEDLASPSVQYTDWGDVIIQDDCFIEMADLDK